ncbi:unnamed protein product [Mesocestoides corti]|uniref:EF-hand domain-containing protein n=2 Tax=Mesocestoides corti TaxID=53468 RepID=A0A0R3UQU7_MESCO|nr:unnamed protein product [Mesocestoides corti]
MPFKLGKSSEKKPSTSSGVVDSLREVFRKFDTNNSGLLEVDEIQAALAELAKPTNTSLIAMILQLKGLSRGVAFEDFLHVFTNIAFG